LALDQEREVARKNSVYRPEYRKLRTKMEVKRKKLIGDQEDGKKR